jgi:Glycosyltransferase family 87
MQPTLDDVQTIPGRPGPGLRSIRLLAFAIGVASTLFGIAMLWFLVPTALMADFRAYYEGAARLNAGQPLYLPGANTNAADFYRYPPLLAIAVRPLALLPFEAAASIWATLIGVAFGLTVLRLGPRGRQTWLVLGILGLPTIWAIVIGQGQVIVTLLLTLGAPWAVALATQVKILPGLVAIYWIGRRDWGSAGRFLAVSGALCLLQFALAPSDSIAFLSFSNLAQVGAVQNLSPYAISPALWFGCAVAGGIVTLVAARTRWGWAAAVTYSVAFSPRLLIYMFSTVAAALHPPPDLGARGGRRPPL